MGYFNPLRLGVFFPLLRIVRVDSIRLLLVILFIISNAALAIPAPDPRLGINVGGLHKLPTAMPFTDLFKISQGWFTSCDFDWLLKEAIDPGCTEQNSFNTQEQHKLNLDRNGYVRSLPERHDSETYTSVVSGFHLDEDFPLGKYVLLYSGVGDIKVSGALNIVSQKAGRIVFDLLSARMGIKIKISRTESNNYIRNIHLVAEKNEKNFQQQPFNMAYLSRMRPFDAIRFMAWTNPRATNLVEWDQHPMPTFAHYTGENGVPVETMIDIANAANAVPWLSMPHQASDRFMREYARMARRRVTGNKKIIIEFSNEMWNIIFPATDYAVEQATQYWPNAYHEESNYERRVKLASNWYGKRSVEMCRIWKQIFGNKKNQIICVIASQSNIAWVGQEALDCPLWQQGPCGTQVDAYAVGPYFGEYIAKLPYRKQVTDWARRLDGIDMLFKEIEQGGMLTNGPKEGAIEYFVNAHMKVSRKLADEYGLPLFAYEAGQHLMRYDPPHKVTDPTLLAFFMRANKNFRMKSAYQRYLKAWEQNGGKTMMHYYGIGKPSLNDFFGMLATPEQTHSPKYDAMLDYMGIAPHALIYKRERPLSAVMLRQRRQKARQDALRKRPLEQPQEVTPIIKNGHSQ